MSASAYEQRNLYRGTPERPWIRLRLIAPSGQGKNMTLVADTGSPFAIVIALSRLKRFLHRSGPRVETNFGDLTGGWVRVAIPGVGLDTLALGFAGDEVVETVRRDSPDFDGLVGLPLLRMMDYGGDADSFWIRRALKHR